MLKRSFGKTLKIRAIREIRGEKKPLITRIITNKKISEISTGQVCNSWQKTKH